MSSHVEPHGVWLGVDVGLVRVGLAASDPGGLLATPVRTLRRDTKKNSDIQLLLREAQERSAVRIIIGLPQSLKGTDTASTTMAREYSQMVVGFLAESGIELPVVLFDERLTTVSAHRVLSEAGRKTKDHRKVVDQVAAVGILQHAMDTQRSLQRDVGEPVRIRAAIRPQDLGGAPSKELNISQPNAGERDSR
ncbi:Holliday junction resolvase RuvX [Arthrobacter roseus]|uniref:Holliday junction resolvase RuvX n=1 Tax=Arthrobacter roseus TaxID=136274 RepID=UPI0019653C14|nr:putative Holliday junction resolvase [Arthrobacter roseus]